MKLIKKKPKESITDTLSAVKDINYGFECLISQNGKNNIKSDIIKFDLSYTNSKHKEDLYFKLTNKLFNSMHRQYFNEKLNYLFVIEYNEILSKGNYELDELEEVRVHCHVVLDTTIPESIFRQHIKKVFGLESDVYFDDLINRSDKDQYNNYLTKQGAENNYLTYKSYNYKICLNFVKVEI